MDTTDDDMPSNNEIEFRFDKEGSKFHSDFNKNDLGHTLICGAKGSGKTVMVKFFTSANIVTKE